MQVTSGAPWPNLICSEPQVGNNPALLLPSKQHSVPGLVGPRQERPLCREDRFNPHGTGTSLVLACEARYDSAGPLITANHGSSWVSQFIRWSLDSSSPQAKPPSHILMLWGSDHPGYRVDLMRCGARTDPDPGYGVRSTWPRPTSGTSSASPAPPSSGPVRASGRSNGYRQQSSSLELSAASFTPRCLALPTCNGGASVSPIRASGTRHAGPSSSTWADIPTSLCLQPSQLMRAQRFEVRPRAAVGRFRSWPSPARPRRPHRCLPGFEPGCTHFQISFPSLISLEFHRPHV